MATSTEARWLVLIHQIPPHPGYLRVKIWRRLQRAGAVAIKNSVYVLPATEQAQEDFEWTLQEVMQGGGDATICEARFVDGLGDEEVIALFNAARDVDYGQLAEDAQGLMADAGLPSASEKTRLRRRFEEVAALDFFGAPGREAAEAALLSVEARGRAAQRDANVAGHDEYRGRIWVTRKGIHVDRMASAWLIRRFIDADAQFKFVATRGYQPLPPELRFDMHEAEFTHEGDACTFEVLRRRFGIKGDAVRHIGEIVHDIDLKDGKFQRPEASGVAAVVAGICRAHRSDQDRLVHGEQLFGHLHAWFGGGSKNRGEVTKPRGGEP